MTKVKYSKKMLDKYVSERIIEGLRGKDWDEVM